MSERRKIEDILAELGKKIDMLVNETRQAGSKASADMEEKVQRLKKQKEKLENDIKNKASSSGRKWDEVKDHLNEAAASLNKAFNSIFK